MQKTELILLLHSLLENPDLVKSALQRINGYPLIDASTDPELNLIWVVIADIFKKTGGLPTLLVLEHQLHARYDNIQSLKPILDEAITVLGVLKAIPPKSVNKEVGEYLLTELVKQAHKDAWLDKLQKLKSVEDFKRFAKQVTTDLNNVNSEIEDELADYPLLCPDRYLVKKHRIPLGMHFWDQMTGGGIAPGEVFGVLGPTGGGKTVLAVNLVVNRAYRGDYAHLYQYEQPVEGDIMERVLTRVLNVPINKFRDKGWGDLHPDLLAKIKEKQDQIGRRLMIRDMSKGKRGAGGVDEIVKLIEKAVKKNEKPSLIVIDWLGAMTDRWLSEKSLDKDNYPTIAGRMLEQFNRLAQDFQLSVIVFHQLNTQVTGKSESVKPKITDAHMVRSFAYKVDSCFCLGNMNKETKVAWFIAGKNRKGVQEETLIRLDGELQTFVSAAGDYVADYRGRFVPAGNAVPINEQIIK